MIKLLTGNLLEADAEALINTVNTVGVMGKGIALQFKQAYPDNYEAYRKACSHHEVQSGKMFVFPTGKLVSPTYIINFPTKRHWKEKSRMEDIEAGLKALVEVVNKLGIHSIAIPPLGCGSGGLKWADVKPRIEAAFRDLSGIHVFLFEPQGKSLAIFSSIKCPGDIIIKTYDLICQLRDAGVTVIGGFHSPMEQECLNILFKGKQPVIICPARSIEKMKIKEDFKKPLEDARLLILSSFYERENRITMERAARRNRFIAAMADAAFIAHAEPDSKTEQLCREIIAWDKPLYTIDSNSNKNLLSMAVAPVTAGNMLEWMMVDKTTYRTSKIKKYWRQP